MVSTLAKLQKVAVRSPRVKTSTIGAHPRRKDLKKKGGGGKKAKNKGSTYERYIANKFKKWFGGSVERTPRSGGWQGAEEHGLKADLVFGEKKAKYHCELKKQEGWEMTDLITGKRSLESTSKNSIEKWWQQTIGGCPDKKIPMLIFTRNHREDFLMVYTSDMDKLAGKKNHGWWAFLPHFRIQSDGISERTVLCLDDLFKFVKPPKYAPNRKLWKRGVL